MVELDYGLPIRVFYANLLKAGLELRVDNSKLVVDGNVDILSPVLKEEIVKRSKHLIELLTPAPTGELAPYFGRLLYLDELKQALTTAEQLKVIVDATPCNGGWLLSTAKTCN
jgi:hypothetical protein